MAKQWKRFAFYVLILYLVVGFFLFPAIGSVALICMLAPVAMARFRGREWCGVYCPRGSFWDNVMAKIKAHGHIPAWAKSPVTRAIMLFVIFTVFGWQMYYAWPDVDKIGLVFLRIIFVTTIIGIVLALLYSPRTWCSFCPMGTLASLLSKGRKPIRVANSCVSCGLCAKACPLELAPYLESPIFTHRDCLKCGECIAACPMKALTFKDDAVASDGKVATRAD